MNDILMFACLAIVIIGAVALFSSARKGPLGMGPTRGAPGQGPNRPQHDNPNIASGGSFGGPGGQSVGSQTPTYDSPNIASGGSFGGPGGQTAGGPARPTHDNPNIASGGSFGGGQSVGTPGRSLGGSTGSSTSGSTSGWGGSSSESSSSGSGGSSRIPSARDMDFGDRNTDQGGGNRSGTVGGAFAAGGRNVEGARPGGRSLDSTPSSSSTIKPAAQNQPDEEEDDDKPQSPRHDNPNIKSGGSFGG